MKRLLIALIALTLSACATLADSNTTARVAVQYATLKVIEESKSISAADVLEKTSQVRSLIKADFEVSPTNLFAEVVAGIDLSGLSASDQLLVSVLLQQIEYRVTEIERDPDISGRLVSINILLDWIEQAALLAE